MSTVNERGRANGQRSIALRRLIISMIPERGGGIISLGLTSAQLLLSSLSRTIPPPNTLLLFHEAEESSSFPVAKSFLSPRIGEWEIPPRWRQGRGWVADREQMRCISYGNNLNDRRYCNSPPEDDEATKGGEEAARRMKKRRGGKKVATRNGNNKIWRSRELGERGMWVQRETGWGQVGRGRREDRVF